MSEENVRNGSLDSYKEIVANYIKNHFMNDGYRTNKSSNHCLTNDDLLEKILLGALP